MPSEKTPRTGGSSQSPNKALSDLKAAILSMVESVPNAALELAGSDPDAALVRANVKMVKNIFEKSFAKIEKEFAGGNAVAVEQAFEFLEITDGLGFAQRTEKVGVAAFKSKLFGGNIWQWLGQNMTEIKKIIGMILGIFSKKLEAWWKRLEPLIDEIWNLVMSLLGGILGFNKREIARDLSMAEVNYLNEMTAHAKLLQVLDSNEDFDDD